MRKVVLNAFSDLPAPVSEHPGMSDVEKVCDFWRDIFDQRLVFLRWMNITIPCAENTPGGIACNSVPPSKHKNEKRNQYGI